MWQITIPSPTLEKRNEKDIREVASEKREKEKKRKRKKEKKKKEKKKIQTLTFQTPEGSESQ